MLQNTAPLPATDAEGIEITAQAALRIREALVRDQIAPEQGGLRLGVQGGGCSGMSYVIRFESGARERDHIFERDGARVFVDPKSYQYLKGLTLDHQESLMQRGFVLHNPNAKRSCGCGTSFSV